MQGYDVGSYFFLTVYLVILLLAFYTIAKRYTIKKSKFDLALCISTCFGILFGCIWFVKVYCSSLTVTDPNDISQPYGGYAREVGVSMLFVNTLALVCTLQIYIITSVIRFRILKSLHEYPQIVEIIIIAIISSLAFLIIILTLIYALLVYQNVTSPLIVSVRSWAAILTAIFELLILMIDTGLAYIFLLAIMRLKQKIISLRITDQVSNANSNSLLKVGKVMVGITALMWILAILGIALNIGRSQSPNQVMFLTILSNLAIPAGIWFSILFQKEVKRLMDYTKACNLNKESTIDSEILYQSSKPSDHDPTHPSKTQFSERIPTEIDINIS